MQLFGGLLCVKTTRLHDVLNAGRLMVVLPAWASVRLSGGWSAFWDVTRKIAKAVRRQPNVPSAQAAVRAVHDALHERHVPPSWLTLLTVITDF